MGSSEKGPEDAQVLAEAVKTYLVDVFGIITTNGRFHFMILEIKE